MSHKVVGDGVAPDELADLLLCSEQKPPCFMCVVDTGHGSPSGPILKLLDRQIAVTVLSRAYTVDSPSKSYVRGGVSMLTANRVRPIPWKRFRCRSPVLVRTPLPIASLTAAYLRARSAATSALSPGDSTPSRLPGSTSRCPRSASPGEA